MFSVCAKSENVLPSPVFRLLFSVSSFPPFVQSQNHLLRFAFKSKGVALQDSWAHRWVPESHYLQGILDKTVAGALLRINSVILRLRWLRMKGLAFNNAEDMVRHGVQLYVNEGLRCTRPSTTRAERKHARLIPPPVRRGFVLYRSDGAARGQGGTSQQRAGSGWGAVCFGGSGQDTVPEIAAWGWLAEDQTNNEAEYVGLLAVLSHARARGYRRVCFQLDSLLVAKQVTGEWACRAHILHPYYAEATRTIESMEETGTHVIIEHMYREFNTHADKYANVAVDARASCGWHSL